MTERLIGHAALDAMLAHLEPAGGERGPSEDLRGRKRDAYASHRAFVAFVAAVRTTGADTIYEERRGAVPLDQISFGLEVEGEDDTASELPFSVGRYAVEVDSVRIRQAVPGVWLMVDRWADDVTVALMPDAPFDTATWEIDEWDLPAPVPPLIVGEGQAAAFSECVTAFAAALLDTRPIDRAHAEALIVAHYRVCQPRSPVPRIEWFSSPNAALNALAREDPHSLGVTKMLRDRPLAAFDQEVTARLRGRGDALRQAMRQKMSDALGVEIQGAIMGRLLERKVQGSFDYMGLTADHHELIWFEFLRHCGVDLPEAIASFCAMTAQAWLIFPRVKVVFAVARPGENVSVGKDRVAMIFADGDRLELQMTPKEMVRDAD